ncbi:hypothetical protein K2173_027977 [Erythroxylum novogranatense]|uniref:Inositol polyphosphate-related phosphatase domain-containing protein n=1 Tax=Erythroxylum novogranatense TaxID=1862640 RepID=A0AAV8U478_9ROSI|nr:hypothetical protein K2173_027977 [Erythroxylum novogranatense]
MSILFSLVIAYSFFIVGKFLRSNLMMKQMESLNGRHEGIKSMSVGNLCDFSGNSKLCICVVTWNMNGQVSYQDLVELFGRSRNFDLLVVGLQEVPRRNISRLLQAAVVDTLTLLGEAVMQSLQLYVFGPQNSGLFIRELTVDKHSFGGFGGLIRRNKGAAAIRINYKGIVMVFISCHLSAHAHNVEERNWQCQHLTHNLFSKNPNPYARPAHITVWLGDLNFRIEGIDTYPARNLIDKDLHRLLTSKDQLLQEAAKGRIFSGFCEGTLTFKPTYKYNIGSSNYDTSYKVRVPSWTDRILFRMEDSDKISAILHSYNSVDNIYSSDHKPVKAHICLRPNERPNAVL